MVNKEDILEALGIQNNNSWWLYGLAGFGIGCVVGAGVAMLIAPKTGAELRSQLMERGRDLINKGKEQFPNTMETMGKSPTTPTY
jgi:gas vesicle protein